MRNYSRGWLAGFLHADVQKTDTSRRLTLNIFLAFPNASVKGSLIDRNEQEIVDNNDRPVTLFEHDLHLNGPMSIPFSRQNQRPLQLFGRRRPFYCGNVVADIPNDLWSQCRYVALNITPMSDTPGEAGGEHTGSSPSEHVYLEMSRKRLASFGPPKLFLMTSKGEARKRMEKLLRKFRQLRRQHDDVRHALSSLMTKMFRGGDNELLTEDL